MPKIDISQEVRKALSKVMCIPVNEIVNDGLVPWVIQKLTAANILQATGYVFEPVDPNNPKTMTVLKFVERFSAPTG